jgi:hypothetical protein
VCIKEICLSPPAGSNFTEWRVRCGQGRVLWPRAVAGRLAGRKPPLRVTRGRGASFLCFMSVGAASAVLPRCGVATWQEAPGCRDSRGSSVSSPPAFHPPSILSRGKADPVDSHRCLWGEAPPLIALFCLADFPPDFGLVGSKSWQTSFYRGTWRWGNGRGRSAGSDRTKLDMKSKTIQNTFYRLHVHSMCTETLICLAPSDA